MKAHIKIENAESVEATNEGGGTSMEAAAITNEKQKCSKASKWTDARPPAHDAVAPEGDLGGATDDDGSLCFVPAFGDIQTPLGDDFACAALMGWAPKLGTRRRTVGQHRRREVESVINSRLFTET
ncbi:hypothetical protein GPALN_002331 [Globodera pallida]|nr:hypothetical protein GPALN_002331 [Globodera pallida]